MKFIVFLLALFAVSQTFASVANFTPFNFAGEYIINGTYSEQLEGTINTFPVAIVFDTANNRFAAIATGVITYVFNNLGGYIFGDALEGECYSVPTTYSQIATSYSNVVRDSGILEFDSWSGNAVGAALCGNNQSVHFQTINNGQILVHWAYTQPIVVGTSCANSNNILDFDLTTLKTGINFSPYFALPASCSDADDYCDELSC